MADSVLIGDSAYEVVPGYVAEVAAPAPAGRQAEFGTGPAAAFLLNKMG